MADRIDHRSGALWRAVQVLTKPARGRGWYTRSPVLRRAYRSVQRVAAPKTVSIYGQVIEVDPKDSMRLLTHREYEPEETAWYREVLAPGDTVVEAGAHIGLFTNLFASLVGDSGRVIAFEPDPETARLLRANVARNAHIDRVVVHEAAVGAAPGQATFFRSAENTGDNRLFGDAAEDAGFSVPIVRLDDVLGDLEVDLLKLDVQGAEPAALAGMSTLLETRPPRRILLEFWPYGMRSMGLDAEAMLDLLDRHGYELAELDRERGGPVAVERQSLRDRLTPDSEQWTNIVATYRTRD